MQVPAVGIPGDRAPRRCGARRVLAFVACLLFAPPAWAVAPGDVVVADFPAAPAPSGLMRFNAAGNPIFHPLV